MRALIEWLKCLCGAAVRTPAAACGARIGWGLSSQTQRRYIFGTFF